MEGQLMKLVPAAGGWVVASAVGSQMSGAAFTDVMFSMDGALGAAVGVFAGQYVAPVLPDSLRMVRPYTGLLLGMGVPMAVAMKVDTTSALLGASAFVGAYAVSNYVLPMLNKSKNGQNGGGASSGSSGSSSMAY